MDLAGNNDGKIITITDLLQDKEAKQKELDYYEMCLKDLVIKMQMVRGQIGVTETIINMIKSENDTLFEDFMAVKDKARILDI
jgi:hypothetical protein